jgi:hypothetical protein
MSIEGENTSIVEEVIELEVHCGYIKKKNSRLGEPRRTSVRPIFCMSNSECDLNLKAFEGQNTIGTTYRGTAT